MFHRQIQRYLKEQLGRYPAVALVGPRQAGKTTLARTFSQEYFDLEKPSDQVRLETQLTTLLQQRKLIIFDEAQCYPPLFGMLRGIIDANRKENGKFLLLGSVAPSLMREISESLVGRLALLRLYPLNYFEIGQEYLDPLWAYGGYPNGGVIDSGQFPQWQKNYIDLMAQKDLPQYGIEASPSLIKRFMRILAASHGNMWNASEIGRALGLSYHTINSYVEYFEGTFLVRRLEPYSVNLHKRLVKSPKIYWWDSGLLHALLGVQNFDHLLNQPWLGNSWEGFAIEQILSFLDQSGIDFNPYYFRTSDGYEIDLVLEIHSRIWAIEIKLSSEPRIEDTQKLKKAAAMIRAEYEMLICRTDVVIANESQCYSNLWECMQYLKEKLNIS